MGKKIKALFVSKKYGKHINDLNKQLLRSKGYRQYAKSREFLIEQNNDPIIIEYIYPIGKTEYSIFI